MNTNDPTQLRSIQSVIDEHNLGYKIKDWQADGRVNYLTPAAAYAFAYMWKALIDAGYTRKDHLVLGNTYRTIETQNEIFDWDRYVRSGGSRTDQAKRPGTECYGTGGAAAAFPGTSNHGWGIAFDLNPAKKGTPPNPVSRWISHYGKEWGWTWAEGKNCSEIWHMKYKPDSKEWPTQPGPKPPRIK